MGGGGVVILKKIYSYPLKYSILPLNLINNLDIRII